MKMNVVWTDIALSSLDDMIIYILCHFNDDVVSVLLNDIDRAVELISDNNRIGQFVDNNLRKILVNKYTWLVYDIQGFDLVIILVYSPRDNPKKLEILFS